MSVDRVWTGAAIAKLEAENNRSADTHLLRLDDGTGSLAIYFKDETAHSTGSLKHRLARSLFLYAICNGWIGPDTVIVEASSGSTAISEAWFARLLGLRFIAIVPHGTAAGKIAEIGALGGECREVPAHEIYDAAVATCRACGGHYMDQFTHAERATDWRGNNNIGEAIFRQLAHEARPEPDWIVVGAGTGGTSATIGRYVRYRRPRIVATRLAVVDPEGSVFGAYWNSRDATISDRGSRIEGIGRPRVEPSFLPDVIDRMIAVPDVESFAAARVLSDLLRRKVGPSSGTNFIGVLRLAEELRSTGREGAIVSLLCDEGERYDDTLFDDDWLDGQVDGWRDNATAIKERWDKLR